jgi:D-alanyl-D-alanine carboxypeptidase (penicillin-binding protein 5/6)
MRRLVLATVVALGFAGSARAAAPSPDARAFYVMNAATGEVLAAHNAHQAMPIASITKLMTVLVALKHLKPTDVVTVSDEAAQVGESRIPLSAGERVTVGDLLAGALIQSANNAADALAYAAAHGDMKRFVGWMNARAHALGLRDTHFARADGLDAPDHVSSAHDVAVLAQVAMHSPIVRDLVSRKNDTIEGGTVALHTWNDLLGVFPGLIGVKTGHTNDAGWCQVAAARRSGYTIYAVILGSPTRAQRNADLQALLGWGVSQYRTLRLIDVQTYAWAAAPFGRPAVALVARKRLVRALRVGHPVIEKIIAPTAVSLPVERGQLLGRIEVWSRGKLLGSRPLVAGRSVSRPDAEGRLRWYSTRTVHNLFGLFS